MVLGYRPWKHLHCVSDFPSYRGNIALHGMNFNQLMRYGLMLGIDEVIKVQLSCRGARAMKICREENGVSSEIVILVDQFIKGRLMLCAS